MATTRPRGTADPEEPTVSPSAPDDAPGSGAEDLISPENRAILHHALEEAARLLRSDGAIAYLADPASGVMRFADDAGIADPDLRAWVRTLRVTAGSGLVGRAVDERRIVATDDYPVDPSFVHFEGADRLVDALAIHSFLAAPMIAGPAHRCPRRTKLAAGARIERARGRAKSFMGWSS